jgi:hypothetical protein
MSNRLKITLLLAALSLAAGQALAFPFPKEQAAPAETPAAAAPAAPATTPADTAPVPVAPAAPAATAPAAPATPPNFTKGTVVETMTGGGYTYVCIEKDGQKRWAAMPPTQVKVGEEVELGSGMEMGKFTSKTLNRSFDQIYFCGGLVKPKANSAPGQSAAGNGQSALPHPVPTGQAMPPGHAGMTPGGQAGMPPGHPATPAAPTPEQAAQHEKASSSKITGKVVETLQAGTYTYVNVEKDGKNSWVAIPPTKLEVGQDVEFIPGFVMTNFSSGTLNRTFETITFSAGVVKPQ